MPKGTIKKLMEKGFGFISREGESKDLFFHMSALDKGVDFNDLVEGQTVEFEVGKGDKGPRAENVRVV